MSAECGAIRACGLLASADALCACQCFADDRADMNGFVGTPLYAAPEVMYLFILADWCCLFAVRAFCGFIPADWCRLFAALHALCGLKIVAAACGCSSDENSRLIGVPSLCI